MIRIILAEDHLVVRTGIEKLLAAEADMEVVGLVARGEEVLTLLDQGVVADLILSDISMPGMDGLELLRQLKAKEHAIPVLILSMLDSEKFIFDAFELGARGYILKNATNEELIFCIRQVAVGMKVVCNEISIKLLERAARHQPPTTNTLELNDRELEILDLISKGLTNKEIADKVFASRRTVEGHRQALVLKAGVKNTAELILLACKSGLI